MCVSAGQTYSEKVVETDQFRHILEKHCRQSLAQFFDQWFKKAGYPKLKIKYKYSHKEESFSITTEQTIVGSAKGEEKQYFEFPLEISVQEQDETWLHHTLNIDGKTNVLKLKISARPQQIVIDPNSKAVCEFDFNPGFALLKKSLHSSHYIHGRIHAARTIIKEGKRIGYNEIGPIGWIQSIGP